MTSAHATFVSTYVKPGTACFRPLRAVRTIILAAIAAFHADAQWTVTNLHPAGAAGSSLTGVCGTQQVGVVTINGKSHASLWTGTSATWVDLHPDSATRSEAVGTSGTRQVGTVWFNGVSHAIAWSGSSATWLDLSPAASVDSGAYAISGDQVVGYVDFADSSLRATLWHLDSNSITDLSPGTLAFAVDTTEQAGATPIDGWFHASLWRGSAASRVDLHSLGDTYSFARGTNGGYQVGYGGFNGGSSEHALLWAGSASSCVDLHPTDAQQSRALGVSEGYQVGYTTLDRISHASIWRGSAASRVDLHTFLPAEFSQSQATAIWTGDGMIYVAGSGVNTATNRGEALLWSKPLCVCEITSQPTAARACQNATATLSVTADGVGLQYRWRRDQLELADDDRITGSHTSTLHIRGVTPDLGGSYDCVVSNSCGSDISKPAALIACVSDLNCDGEVDLSDFFQFFGCWALQFPCADLDGVEGVDLGDFFAFFNAFDQSC